MIIVWLSANEFGYMLLRRIAIGMFKGQVIDAIITLHANASTVMYDYCDKFNDFNIPTHYIYDINHEDELLEALNPDIIVVAGWRQMIKKELLDKYTFIGFHPTLLPKGRGSAPIINTILEDFEHTGVTMFYLENNVDSGDIIDQCEFEISSADNARNIYDKVINCGERLIYRNIQKMLDGTLPRISQDDTEATYFKKPNLKDNKIDLDDDLEYIHKKIRALSSPYNGAYIEKDGKKLIIWEAELIDEK